MEQLQGFGLFDPATGTDPVKSAHGRATQTPALVGALLLAVGLGGFGIRVRRTPTQVMSKAQGITLLVVGLGILGAGALGLGATLVGSPSDFYAPARAGVEVSAILAGVLAVEGLLLMAFSAFAHLQAQRQAKRAG